MPVGINHQCIDKRAFLDGLAFFLGRQQQDNAVNFGRVGVAAAFAAFFAFVGRVINQYLHGAANALAQFLGRYFFCHCHKAGAALGAHLIGQRASQGVGGSAIGGGRGSIVTAVIGAVAGGLLGSATEEGLTRTQGVEITVREDDGSIRAYVQAVQENYADQPHVEAQVAMLIANQAADNDNQVSIQQVRQQLEEEYPLAAVPFDDYVEKSDVLEAPEQPVTVTPARIRRMESRSIHTANGIEVKIPTELLNSDNEVEFLHSDDGSISLLIKNVIL